MHQEKLSAIFNSASTAIIVFTPQQEIIFSNTAALRLFGYSDLTNVCVFNLFYPDDYLIIQTFLDDLEYKNLTSKSIRAIGSHKNGDKLPLRITLKKITGLPSVSYYVALIETKTYSTSDIPQQSSLPLLYQEVQTSLDTLTSAIQLLLKGNPRPEQSIYLKLIEASGNHLKKAFNHALTHTNEETAFEFRKIIEDIKKVYKEQGISLRLLIEEDIPRMLKGDPDYLKQTLHYLISHILKLANKGNIFIQIYLHQNLQTMHILLFKITCSNMRLTYLQANSMIKKLNEAIHNKYRHLSLKDIKQPTFQITLDYRSDNNTVFHLYLSFTTSREEDLISTGKESYDLLKKPLLEGLKVLYVDDVTSNQLLMEGLCHHWRVSLDSAFSGAEALEKIRHTPYDVVLMDLYMPDMDGFETVYRIRNSTHLEQADIPVLAVSASVSEDAQNRANSVGMNDFITKPINPDLLFQKLAHFLK